MRNLHFIRADRPRGYLLSSRRVSGFGQRRWQISALVDAANGSLGIFGIESDGRLTNYGVLDGLPAGARLNGIAAN